MIIVENMTKKYGRLTANETLPCLFDSLGVLIGHGILALWELIAALGCFALSKGVLHRCDMPVMPTGKR
jgi:hypothetical protein